MEITDVEQRLVFLDQEHRRGRLNLDRLRTQSSAQAAELAALSEQFAALVDDVQHTQNRLAELETFETQLTQVRDELINLVQAQTSQNRVEIERLRGQDNAALDRVESLAQTLQTVRTDLDHATRDIAALHRTEETHTTSVAELAHMVQAVRTDLDHASREIASLQRVEDTQSTSVTELAHTAQALRADVDKAIRAIADLQRGEDTQIASIADLAKGVQQTRETAATALREARALQTADTLQTERLTHLAEQTQKLFDGVAGAGVGVEQLRGRVDTHTTETAALYRLAQGLEERMTSAQAISTELRDRLTRQNDAMVEVGRTLQSLRADLTATQGQLIKFPQIEQALQIAKDEITAMVREYRVQHVAEFERATQERLAERQNTAIALGQINQRLEDIAPIQARLTSQDREAKRLNQLLSQLDVRLLDLTREVGQRAEPIPFLNEQLQKHDARLGYLERDVANVDHKIDAKSSPIPFLDESLLALTKRVDLVEAELPKHQHDLVAHHARIRFLDGRDDGHAERLDQIEAKLPGLSRADIELLEKVDFLEEWVQRTATRLDELQRFEDELRRTLAEVVEAEKVRSAHRDQRMSGWAEELVEHRRIMDDWRKVLRGYEEHHQGVTRQMQAMEELGQQLSHQQRASLESHRIEAEKIRREVAEWRQDVDKRWALFFKQRDWDWSQQKVLNQVHAENLAKLEQWRAADVQSATDLATRLDNKDRELLMRIEDVWEAEETYLQRRIADLKTWLGEVQETQAKSPKPRVPKPGEKIVGSDPRYRKP